MLENREVPAITFNVDVFTDTPDATPGDGVAKDANNKTSLRAAIMEGNALLATHNSVTITFNQPMVALEGGTVPVPQTILLGTALPSLTNNFTINGLGVSLLKVKRDPAAGQFRIFYVNAASDSFIADMTITGGNTGQSGGGILNEGHLSLATCDVTNNHSGGSGGGIRNIGTLSACGVYVGNGNTATGDGGGIFNLGTLYLSASEVNGNSSDARGGGIFTTGNGVCEIDDTLIRINSAMTKGGGICVFNQATFTMTGGEISDNELFDVNNSWGGGIFIGGINGSGATLTGVDITDNQATSTGGKGGGFYVEAGSAPVFDTCTISGNNATVGDGGAVEVGGDYTPINCTITDGIALL